MGYRVIRRGSEMTHKSDIPVRLTFVLSILIALISCTKPEPKLQRFSRMEIIYVEHWRMTYTTTLSYEKLMRGDFPYHQIDVTDTSELRPWVDALDSSHLIPAEARYGGDCRVFCRFFSESGVLLHQLSMWPAGIELDNTIYYMDSTFMRLLEPHLPRGYF